MCVRSLQVKQLQDCRTRRQSGQSLIEFALTLPILLLIVLGALDLGRVFNAYVAITNASREGARYGASNPADTMGIKNRVVIEAAGSGIVINASDPSAIKIDCYRVSDDFHYAQCNDAYKGDKIQVTVEFNFEFMTLYLLRVPNVRLSTATTMALINGK
jgi:Flp pilus assembly protein TadG